MSRESDTRLFVGRLSRDVRERDLEDLFSRYGTIKNVSLKSTYGFVVCFGSGDEKFVSLVRRPRDHSLTFQALYLMHWFQLEPVVDLILGRSEF